MLNSHSYNPDVLTCLANLSSDEIFTPPHIVNQMLDLLPRDLWTDKASTFLDPGCKSGVFLREITKRLDEGLERQIPDREQRINHILKNQVYGLAITEMTALLSRRSVYCSKHANGKYSVCEDFDEPDGNIRFEQVGHTWQNGRCVYCGASNSKYERGVELETHAYQFIHTGNPEEIFNMKFDVIIGNPPYQLSDGGFGRSASPIYQKFVEQAKRMNPRYLTMIIPARWFAGGKGLNDFRSQMLSDNRISKIIDFEDSSEVFPGVSVAGGICYFLWDKEYDGLCEIVNVHNSLEVRSLRRLDEFSTFIRHAQAVPIVRKIIENNELKMNSMVSSYKPFGLRTYVKPQKSGDIVLYWQGGEGPYNRNEISVGLEMIDQWKVVTSRSGNEHAGNPGKDGARRVLAKIAVLPPGTVCTETYLVIGSFDERVEAENLVAYMRTRFFRFLMSLFMYSHGITKDTFLFIPVLDMKIRWTDKMLYTRYGLNKDDVAFIESKIRPMEAMDE